MREHAEAMATVLMRDDLEASTRERAETAARECEADIAWFEKAKSAAAEEDEDEEEEDEAKEAKEEREGGEIDGDAEGEEGEGEGEGEGLKQQKEILLDLLFFQELYANEYLLRHELLLLPVHHSPPL